MNLESYLLSLAILVRIYSYSSKDQNSNGLNKLYHFFLSHMKVQGGMGVRVALLHEVVWKPGVLPPSCSITPTLQQCGKGKRESMGRTAFY